MVKSTNHIRFISEYDEVLEYFKNWLYEFLAENPEGYLKDCKIEENSFQIVYASTKYEGIEVNFNLIKHGLYWTKEGLPEELKNTISRGLEMNLPA